MLQNTDRRIPPAATQQPVAPGAFPAQPVEQPLRAWSASEKERLLSAVREAAQRWHEAWGVEPGEHRAGGPPESIQSPFDATASELGPSSSSWREAWPGLWWAFAPVGGHPALRAPGGEETPHLASLSWALFGEPAISRTLARKGQHDGRGAAPGALAEKVARAVWADWWGKLGEPLVGAGEADLDGAERSLPAGVWTTWSGSLLVTLPWLEGWLKLLVTGERVARILRPDARAGGRPERGAPLTPVWQAVSGREARLRVVMRAFDLELAALAGLRVGDVLQTTHRLDAPLAMTMDDCRGGAGEAVCAAFLGRAGTQRAVDLRRALRTIDATVSPASGPSGAQQTFTVGQP